MRKVLTVAASLALLVSGACGGGGGKKASSTTSTTSTGPTTPTTLAAPSGAELSAKAIAVADLPPGWKRNSLDVDPTDTTPLGCAPIDSVDQQYASQVQRDVEDDFQNGSDDKATQFFHESLNVYPSAEVARQYFEDEAAGFTACKAFGYTDTDGSRSSGQMGSYPFPLIGDGSAASALTGTITFKDVGPVSLGGPIVLLRAGRVIVQLSVTHLGSAPGPTGNDVIAIANKAVAKLSA